MKFNRHTLVAAALLTGLGLTAVAQTAVPAAPAAPQAGASAPAPGMMHGMREGKGHFDPARMQERMAKRQAELKQKLAITPAQEGAWNAWTTAMQPPANLQRIDRQEMAKLTTPERIDRMRALRTERNALMDKRADATKAFYAALNADQKKAFDAETARGHRGHRFGGFGPRGHHGHHG